MGGADLRFFSPQPGTSLHCQTTDTGLVHHACGVTVYIPAFAGTHCTYPRRDGEAELTWHLLSEVKTTSYVQIEN